MDMKSILRAFTSGVSSADGLARKLGVSSDAIRSRLDTLCSLGYLEAVGDGCEESKSFACSGCSSSSACASEPASPLTGWRLTDKGKKLVALK